MMLDIFKEQQIVIKFLVKLGKTGAEIMPMLNNVYGKVTMNKSADYVWIQHFWDGREDVNDDLEPNYKHSLKSNEHSLRSFIVRSL